MIALDIETSGLDKVRCGIWQIGAYDLLTGEIFFEEARIDDDDVYEDGSKKAHGKDESFLRDSKKQSQKELIQNFMNWVSGRKENNFICQNPQFDVSYIEVKANKYNLFITFPHRSYDLHSIAQTIYFLNNGEFLIRYGKTQMNFSNVLNLVGLKDERKDHNALEDAKLNAEVFSRIFYKKKLFDDYADYEIPSEIMSYAAR